MRKRTATVLCPPVWEQAISRFPLFARRRIMAKDIETGGENSVQEVIFCQFGGTCSRSRRASSLSFKVI